jgi:hypothetical protein
VPDGSTQLGQRPLTRPEVALSAVLGVLLPLAGLIVVAMAMSVAVRQGQRTATLVLAAAFLVGVAVLAVLIAQV